MLMLITMKTKPIRNNAIAIFPSNRRILGVSQVLLQAKICAQLKHLDDDHADGPGKDEPRQAHTKMHRNKQPDHAQHAAHGLENAVGESLLIARLDGLRTSSQRHADQENDDEDSEGPAPLPAAAGELTPKDPGPVYEPIARREEQAKAIIAMPPRMKKVLETACCALRLIFLSMRIGDPLLIKP